MPPAPGSLRLPLRLRAALRATALGSGVPELQNPCKGMTSRKGPQRAGELTAARMKPAAPEAKPVRALDPHMDGRFRTPAFRIRVAAPR
jgi:hypothetical protein